MWLQQNCKHLQSFLDFTHFIAVYALCFLLASPPSALNWSTQGFHHGLCRSRPGIPLPRLPNQALCFTFGRCTGASLTLGCFSSYMECPHRPGSRWRQFHGLSLVGQEPCLGSLLLPRMTSLQTGVVSSCSDFGMFLALSKFNTAEQEECKVHFISIFPESSFFLQCF